MSCTSISSDRLASRQTHTASTTIVEDEQIFYFFHPLPRMDTQGTQEIRSHLPISTQSVRRPNFQGIDNSDMDVPFLEPDLSQAPLSPTSLPPGVHRSYVPLRSQHQHELRLDFRMKGVRGHSNAFDIARVPVRTPPNSTRVKLTSEHWISTIFRVAVLRVRLIRSTGDIGTADRGRSSLVPRCMACLVRYVNTTNALITVGLHTVICV